MIGDYKLLKLVIKKLNYVFLAKRQTWLHNNKCYSHSCSLDYKEKVDNGIYIDTKKPKFTAGAIYLRIRQRVIFDPDDFLRRNYQNNCVAGINYVNFQLPSCG